MNNDVTSYRPINHSADVLVKGFSALLNNIRSKKSEYQKSV